MAWAGAVHLGEGWMLYEGALAPAATHRHHATQLVVSSEPFIVADAGGAEVTTTAALIPASAAHRLTAGGQPGVSAYVEPVGSGAAEDAHAWAENATALGPLVLSTTTPARFRVDALLRSLGAVPPVPISPIVARSMEVARYRMAGTVHLRDVAAEVGLSSSRLGHVFTIEAGIPFRRWVLWERLRIAGGVVAGGSTLTESAHAAGFADSAHLNRTFRRMFGIAPTDVVGHVTWVVDG